MKYFQMIVIISLCFFLQIAKAVIPESERNALLAIIQFAGLEYQENWSGLIGVECSWRGVLCDETQKHVVGLSLSFSSLTHLAPEIVQLPALKNLSLSGNLLTTIPPEIVQLTNLLDLDLSINHFSKLPPEIFQLTSLTHLNLHSNLLTALPPEIGQLTALNVLVLHSNQLTTLPPEFGKLTALGGVLLQHNQLTELPPEIKELIALRDLVLNDNQLLTLPAEIGQLPALENLFLGTNQLTELPSEITQIKGLEELSLYDNQLTELPSEIGQLTALTNLTLNSNQLNILPSSIGTLTALTQLSLDSNQLTKLPSEIGQLTALTNLTLKANQLNILPSSIGTLTALTHLSLDSNQLTELPLEIGKLTALTHLSLDYNQLTSLPPEIGRLNTLTILSLNSNQLTILPPDVGQLIALNELQLSDNLLSNLPEALMEIKEKEDCFTIRGSEICDNVRMSLTENCLSETTLSAGLIEWLNSKKVALNSNWQQQQKHICVNSQPIPAIRTLHFPDSQLIDFINTDSTTDINEPGKTIAFSVYEEGKTNREASILASGSVEQIGSDTWRIDTQGIAEGNYEIVFWTDNELSTPPIQAWNRSFIKVSNETNLADGKDLSLSFAFNNPLQFPELSSALNLDYPLFSGDITPIEKIKQIPGFSLLQYDNGYLKLNELSKLYTARPFKIEKNKTDSEQGYLLDEDGFINLITSNNRTLLAATAIDNLQAFKAALSEINLPLLKINQQGLILMVNQDDLSNLLVARSSLFSEPARKNSVTPGLSVMPVQGLNNVIVAYHIYSNEQGQLIEQAVPPMPFNWDFMKSELQSQGFTQIKLAIDGMISAEKNNILHRAFMSYQVKKVETDLMPGIFRIEDLNSDGYDDALIIYRNDSNQFEYWEQTLYLFPAEQIN